MILTVALFRRYSPRYRHRYGTLLPLTPEVRIPAGFTPGDDD